MYNKTSYFFLQDLIMLWFHLATFLNQRLKLLNNGIRSLRQWCSRAISLRSPQMRLWLPRETACRGFLGLNPKPTIADFSVCLQDYLDQLACIRSFWGVCVCVCVCVCACACALSHVWLFATLWTEAGQAPLSMGFSRQKYWSRLPCPTPEDLPDQRLKLCLLHRQPGSLP